MASQPNLLKNLNNTMTNSLESIGVCCFTVDPRNLLMWSHYASHHRGIVLQFELARDTSAFLKNVRVVYVNDYPLLNWANETESEISKSFLNKFKTWEYEKEWRMVHIFGANSYINFKPEALTGVIFGCKADGNIKNAVNEMLAERTQKNMPPVNTYNTSMHDSKYRLVIKK